MVAPVVFMLSAATSSTAGSGDHRRERRHVNILERDRVGALARWIGELRFADLPQEVVARVRSLVLDHIGVAMLGAQRPHMFRLREIERGLGGPGGSTVVGTDDALDLDRAAFLNAAAGSSGPNLDDVCHGSLGHPGVGTIPAALSVGEREGASGRHLVEAVVAGYEATMRIGEAIGRSAFDRGWHPRGGCNAMSTAVAALKVTGETDPVRYAGAMGHAANATGGLVGASYFADSWYLLSGNATRAGVLAAEAARAGLTVASGALDGAGGYIQATSDAPDFDALTDGLGESFRLLDAGQKLYPSSGATHAALEAAREAKRQLACRVEDVAEVEIRGFSQMVGVLGQPFPEIVIAATMSTPYVVACTLRDGYFGLKHLEVEQLQDPELRRLQSLMSLLVDARLDRLPPKHLGARVTVRTADGRSAAVEVLTASGHPGSPLSFEAVTSKVRSLLEGCDVSFDLSLLGRAAAELPETDPAEVLGASRPTA